VQAGRGCGAAALEAAIFPRDRRVLEIVIEADAQEARFKGSLAR